MLQSSAPLLIFLWEIKWPLSEVITKYLLILNCVNFCTTTPQCWTQLTNFPFIFIFCFQKISLGYLHSWGIFYNDKFFGHICYCKPLTCIFGTTPRVILWNKYWLISQKCVKSIPKMDHFFEFVGYTSQDFTTACQLFYTYTSSISLTLFCNCCLYYRSAKNLIFLCRRMCSC